VHEKQQVFAEIDFDKSLTTRILHVDERSGYLVVGYGDSKRMNSVLFDYSVLQYRANYRGAHLFFKLSNPLECLHEGKHAIKFDLPDALLWSQRREVERVVVPHGNALHCVYRNEEGEFFRASVFDISLDGMGGVIFQENIALKVGMVLKGCRITYPGFDPITVDLVIRNIKSIAQPDGTVYKRAGVRFMQRPEEIPVLINSFVHNLGN